MDEIIPGLWVGDLPSALNVELLKQNHIFSILSAMRGRITIHETFVRHQILLDDTEEADIMIHFLPSITFIQAELDKGRSVLVHCQAGMSRSVTLVAAYLMYTRHLSPEAALELIRKSRPNIDPNPGFLVQLELFHKASFRISRKDKATRMFYMERATEEVMNGDGTLPPTDMFAKFPRTPSDSTPTTPGGPRRRIRCKMCRQELAAREHMLDHGQLGPATPASQTPAGSRRSSTNQSLSRHSSIGQSRPRLGSNSDIHPRRPPQLSFGGLGDSLSMSALETDDPIEDDGGNTAKPCPTFPQPRVSGGGEIRKRPFTNLPRSLMDSLSISALETEDDDEIDLSTVAKTDLTPANNAGVPSIDAATMLGRCLSDAVIALSPSDTEPGQPPSAPQNGTSGAETTQFSSPGDLAAQLHANPKLAALRTPIAMGMTPIQTNTTRSNTSTSSPPILMNPKCSGYFVEPMKWMEPFLKSGEMAGKIICPNKKCGAKLGNFDWAGVCCGCKTWVTPGFCINRSKVDEIVH
ncbi:uncharacterized protein BT62DRAFT_1051642 [Guyanagaster necrorhizus]|uniref:protein-tyrosine-phosphatase n=1 Tax=Guyanagaster necrorhizus TaxID=856835 RepID=A0A9P7VG80_9AGAR|nr:uncharacterized protein BT62DRAFT_1051642 [Guyanagaster necrorhizus MCA 3950]KAG7439997.1 hypothetical protein BT62DRAFT_1051642 [Guyanagaster necrorhizus MCA 3950]